MLLSKEQLSSEIAKHLKCEDGLQEEIQGWFTNLITLSTASSTCAIDSILSVMQ